MIQHQQRMYCLLTSYKCLVDVSLHFQVHQQDFYYSLKERFQKHLVPLCLKYTILARQMFTTFKTCFPQQTMCTQCNALLKFTKYRKYSTFRQITTQIFNFQPKSSSQNQYQLSKKHIFIHSCMARPSWYYLGRFVSEA